MSISRSPRFPVIGLPEAIAHIEKLFEGEGRGAVAEKVAVNHFGYNTLNGNSSKVLSAMRKYGLVEDAAGGVKISADGILIAAHRQTPSNPERIAAIRRAAEQVELFQTIQKDFGASPSEQNLTAQLVIRGFTQDGAARAARAYRATMALVAAPNGHYDPPGEAPQPAVGDTQPSMAASSTVQRADPGKAQEAMPHRLTAVQPVRQAEGVRMMEGERELTTGLLSKDASFRLIVTGQVGEKEIDRLIRKLQLDKEILAESDAADRAAAIAGGDPDDAA